VTGVTDDRNDPGLRQIRPDGMQEKYLVLSEEERKKGFVRPLRTAYVHEKCGAVTTMSMALAETYARDPKFYGGTYCARCKDHFPVGPEGEFVWNKPFPDAELGTASKVGT
jgi:hypothetical protein